MREESQSLGNKISRSVIKIFFLLATIIASVSGIGAEAYGTELSNGFIDLINHSGSVQYVKNYIDYVSLTGDNLMIRDSITGVDSVVEKNGTNVWRMGFVKYVGGNMQIGGYANNDNYWSDSYPDSLGGWCDGRFYNNVFNGSEAMQDVLIIHDQLGDGIGTLNGGIWTLGEDDDVYWTEDIEFNGVQGDLSQMPVPFGSGGTQILPQMTINPVTPRPAKNPVPANGAVDVDLNVELSWTSGYGAVLHNVYFGTTPDVLENVSFEQPETAIDVEGLEWKGRYYWRVDEVDSEGTLRTGTVWLFDTIDDCSSAIVGDLNGDCVVDLADLALMAENWMQCTRMGTGACL